MEQATPHLLAGEISPEQLTARAVAGDRQAFDRLMEIYWEDIFRMVYYRTFSRHDAEDLTQEVFMRAYINLSRLKRYDRIRPWLYSIAVNQIRDFRRKKLWRTLFVSAVEGDPLDPRETQRVQGDSPLDLVLKEEFWTRVKAFTDSLPRREREVFLLRFLDRLTLREIAAVLNRSESAVKTHLYRAVRKFQRKPSLYRLLQE